METNRRKGWRWTGWEGEWKCMAHLWLACPHPEHAWAPGGALAHLWGVLACTRTVCVTTDESAARYDDTSILVHSGGLISS